MLCLTSSSFWRTKTMCFRVFNDWIDAIGHRVTPPESAKTTVVSFDSLRAILCVGICAYHLSWLPVGFGQAIMEGFFALSGFLVTKSLYSSVPKDTWQPARGDVFCFWARRFRRLGPAFIVFIAISIWVSTLVPSKTVNFDMVRIGLGGLVWISNFLTVHAVLAGKSCGPFGAILSLAVEEQFYLCLPLLIGLLCKTLFWLGRPLQPRHLLALLGVLFATSYAFRFVAPYYHTSIVVESYATQFRVMGFAVGCAAFIWLRSTVARFTAYCSAYGLPLVLGIATAIVGLCLSVRSYHYLAFQLQWAVIPVFFACLCMVLYGWNPRASNGISRLLERGTAYIGRTSYSLYLYHPLVIYLMGAPSDPMPQRVLQFCVSLLCGILSYELVEVRLTRVLFSRWLSFPAGKSV